MIETLYIWLAGFMSGMLFFCLAISPRLHAKATQEAIEDGYLDYGPNFDDDLS